MANIFTTVSSFFEKFKQKAGFAAPTQPQINPYPKKAEAFDPNRQTLLQSYNQAQLRDFITQEPERTLTRLLQNLTDAQLQLRIVENITQKTLLQRICRSNLNKKLKRAAEKKLRELQVDGSKNRLQKTSRFIEQIELFLRNPDWSQARELLADAIEHELPQNAPSSADSSSHPLFAQFEALRNRVKAEIQEYEKTCNEMEKICEKLHSSLFISKPALAQIQERWKDLKKKYAFPKDFETIQRYEQILQMRSTARPTASNKGSKPKKEIQNKEPKNSGETTHLESNPEKKVQEKAEEVRQKQLQTLGELEQKLQSFTKNLGHRNVGNQLRSIQKQLSDLNQWKDQYPEKLEALESLLKELSIKRAQILNEAQWDTWARTDRALRLQTELETRIGELEALTDSETLLIQSRGLGQLLLNSAKEMKDLGSLDRKKDQEIWEKYKTISDRGWVICDKMRELLLEKFKNLLASHSSTPIEFIIPALSNPRAKIELRDSAFKDEVSNQIKALRILWGEVGGRSSEANQEVETVYAKLFETYSRQLNLYLSQQRREEAHQTQLDTAWLEEITQVTSQTKTLLTQAQSFDETLQQKNDVKIPQLLNALATYENETQRIEKSFTLLKGPKHSTTRLLDSAKTTEAELDQILTQLRSTLKSSRSTLSKELTERARQRSETLKKAEELALSKDAEASSALFENLRNRWKTVGALGQSQDTLFDLLFENMRQFQNTRSLNAKRIFNEGEIAELLNARKELLYSLEALTRFSEAKTNHTLSPLPLTEEEQSQAVNKILAFGIKYKQILLLDPKEGVLKETKKIMNQWSGMGSPEEKLLPELWKCYRERIESLLQVSMS